MKGLFRGRWLAVLGGVFGLMLAFSSRAFAQDEPTMADVVRGIDTVWVLMTAFLVFFMQAGFALVEAGFTRSKNTINIMMKNFIDFVMGTLAFWAVGYGLMFGEGTPFIGLSHFFLSGVEGDVGTVPVMAFWLFQLVFAATAATIVSGAMAERTKFVAYLLYSIVISGLIYPIFGHWVWGGGWLAELGFKDFAGSTVVHSVGGWAALVGAWLLGPRLDKYGPNGQVNLIPGHSAALGTLGVFILWLGWFGFNPGSQLAAIGSSADAIALIAANTNIAAAAGAFSAMMIHWLRNGKPDLGSTLNGALGGLVAITAGCAFVSPLSSLIIGLVAGPLIVFSTPVLDRLKIDDAVGAVPVHLVNGVWGTLAVGLFAVDGGLFSGGGFSQLVSQLIGVVACAAWTFATTFILFATIRATVGLRVNAEEEEAGLDAFEHGSSAYPDLLPLPDLAKINNKAPSGTATMAD